MAFNVRDLDNVRQNFTGAASATITLGGTVPNSRSFAATGIASGTTFFGVARAGAEISVGKFTYNGATVAQTDVWYSSNSNNPVTFSSGAAGEIFADAPARLFEHLNFEEITVVSAATFDIGAVHGVRILASGTTGPVTSFGTGTNKFRIVRFAGATLTCNTTSLILIGLANGATRVTASGDIGMYVSDGSGNWREVNWSPAANVQIITVSQQKFTGSGTYTPSAGMIFCIIEACGGGGGGGAAVGAVGSTYSGGGGGSGSTSRLVATAATIGASQTVTIGAAGSGGAAGTNNGTAGGDTSVGSLCIGKGGAGGLYGSSAQVGAGGAAGVAGTGSITPAGTPGLAGIYANGTLNIALTSGNGGSSSFGGGAQGNAGGTVATAGNTAGSHGSGGSGGFTNNVASNAAGGNGSAGVVFITEYCTK